MPILLTMLSLVLSFILLLLPMVANCHFLHNQVKQRTITTTNNLQSFLHNNPHRHLSIPVAFLSIRGGSIEEQEENDTNKSEEDDNGGNFSADFVSSFESELMEIRQQAELEAEAELDKLRLMMGEGQGLVDYEEDSDQGSSDLGAEDDTNSAHHDGDDTSNTVEDNNRNEEQNDGDEESAAVEEETSNISDVGESAVEDEETKDISNVEESEMSEIPEEIEGEQESGEIVQSEDDVVVVTDDSSADEETVSADEDSDSKKQGKPKRSKAKRSKSSKPTSKSSKSNRQLLDDDIDSLSDEGLGTVESLVRTRTLEVEVESRPRGISGFLQSDLVRALSLLIATIVVSVMMQRVQRQMEAQGL